jgi:hypothetical protein
MPLPPQVTSDIPGNPHAFDDSVISLFRTLPELSNFNIVWTNLPLSEPLLLRGVLPPARVNSLSIYAPAGVPSSIDLSKATKNSSGELEIKIENSKSESAGNFLSTGTWDKGFLVMRNYLVPPGTRVATPALVRAADGVVVREAQVLTAGPASTALSLFTNILGKVKLLMFVNSGFLLILRFGLKAKARMCVVLLLASACGALVLYRLMFVVGGRSLKTLSSLFCSKPNELYLASLEKGSEVSQPSTMHR